MKKLIEHTGNVNSDGQPYQIKRWERRDRMRHKPGNNAWRRNTDSGYLFNSLYKRIGKGLYSYGRGSFFCRSSC